MLISSCCLKSSSLISSVGLFEKICKTAFYDKIENIVTVKCIDLILNESHGDEDEATI